MIWKFLIDLYHTSGLITSSFQLFLPQKLKLNTACIVRVTVSSVLKNLNEPTKKGTHNAIKKKWRRNTPTVGIDVIPKDIILGGILRWITKSNFIIYHTFLSFLSLPYCISSVHSIYILSMSFLYLVIFYLLIQPQIIEKSVPKCHQAHLNIVSVQKRAQLGLFCRITQLTWMQFSQNQVRNSLKWFTTF